ncbi:MAG: gamma-glutamyltransferase [Kiloniellales bacterium]|nr:gamma-glutamyltransferase [Kiloniellales bacterium]
MAGRGAGKGAVAAGHPATAAAAREIIEDGGSAVDGALGAMCAACVAEPVLASLGGGGFFLAAGPETPAVLYDFFVETPLRRRPVEEIEFFPIEADFGPATQEFHIGLGAMATPGFPRGLFEVHRQLGRLPMARILKPAIALARNGIALRASEAFIFQVVAPVFTASEAAREVYGSGEGLLKEGEILRQPELAETLEALAEEGDRLFYEGEIAAALTRFCRETGGQITEADLGRYAAVRRRPLERRYRGARVLTNPPPSTGGILIAFALDLLSGRAWAPEDFDSPERLAALARVMALTDRARLESRLHEAMGQAEEDAALRRLFDPDLVARYRARVEGRPAARRGTTHISVVDGAGNLAAVTLSNGEGCGRLLPRTGIMLNNMLGEQDLNPRGFHAWPEGVRLASMMAPSLAFLEHGRIAALGSGGSNRIRTAVLQVLLNLIDFEQPAEQAVAAPRLHVERDQAELETGFPEAAVEAARGEVTRLATWPPRNLFFGGVHVATRDRSGRFQASGDPRRSGVGVTF